MYKLFSILTILIVITAQNAGGNTGDSVKAEAKVVTPQVEDRYGRIGSASLYYLIKFTQWSQDTLMDSVPFRVCLVGDDELNDPIETTLRGKFVGAKPIHSMRLKEYSDFGKCNVIFFGQNGGSPNVSIMDAIADLPILTVSTSENLPAMIRIGKKVNKLHLTVNLKVTERAGLHLSSELLNVVSFAKS